MRLARPGPLGLAGQMALLIALALFVAQAINLGLILQERAALRLEQSTGPAAVRIADALERERNGRPISADRGRVRRVLDDPISTDLERHPEVSTLLRDRLSEFGVTVGRIDTGLRTERPPPPPNSRRHRLRRHSGHGLMIAVEQPGRGWLVLGAPWPSSQAPIVWRLIFQTVILYAIVLLPVLWIARRISRSLRSLGDAARRFGPGEDPGPVEATGPPDVRAVIAAYNALRLRVTAMLEEKDRMLGAIGHDLRTPLAALRVRIESVEDDDDRTRMAETIDEMNQTLDDILSLARLGRPSEAITAVDLGALVDAVVEDFRDLDAPVTYQESPRLTLRLRPSLMRRAVRNLIENALKYGGVAEVSLRPGPHRVAIVVADTGPGIPADRLADVFVPFTRLESSRNRGTGGIGLGLALAQAIVRDAGGEIALANRASGGLEAIITLPR